MPPKYDIIFTPNAVQDLLIIQDFYTEVLNDAYTGERISSGIISKIYSLSIFPKGNARIAYQNEIVIRMAHWRHFNIYYRCNEKALKVHILSIIDAHRHYRPF